ncbi:unnamed protein product, partial [Discosporangium mesarthrocarpum]
MEVDCDQDGGEEGGGREMEGVEQKGSRTGNVDGKEEADHKAGGSEENLHGMDAESGAGASLGEPCVSPHAMRESAALTAELEEMCALSTVLFPLFLEQLPAVLHPWGSPQGVNRGGPGHAAAAPNLIPSTSAARLSSAGAYLRLLLSLVVKSPSPAEAGVRAGLLLRALAKAVGVEARALMARGGVTSFGGAGAGAGAGAHIQESIGGTEQQLRAHSSATDAVILTMWALHYLLTWASS